MRRLLLLMVALALAAPALADSLGFQPLGAREVRLTLPTELGESWREVNVGRLLVRTREGLGAVDRPPFPASAHLDLVVPPRGCAMVEAGLGPAASRGRTDSWQRVTYCAKILRCAPGAGPSDRRRAGPIATGKTGARIEIRPLFNPLQLLPGAVLPVRLYFEGEALAGVPVVARGPGGAEVRGTSDRVGITSLRIPEVGRWTVRLEHRDAVAELVFEVDAS